MDSYRRHRRLLAPISEQTRACWNNHCRHHRDIFLCQRTAALGVAPRVRLVARLIETILPDPFRRGCSKHRPLFHSVSFFERPARVAVNRASSLYARLHLLLPQLAVRRGQGAGVRHCNRSHQPSYGSLLFAGRSETQSVTLTSRHRAVRLLRLHAAHCSFNGRWQNERLGAIVSSGQIVSLSFTAANELGRAGSPRFLAARTPFETPRVFHRGNHAESAIPGCFRETRPLAYRRRQCICPAAANRAEPRSGSFRSRPHRAICLPRSRRCRSRARPIESRQTLNLLRREFRNRPAACPPRSFPEYQ